MGQILSDNKKKWKEKATEGTIFPIEFTWQDMTLSQVYFRRGRKKETADVCRKWKLIE